MRHLGDYTILKDLGRGSLGTSYLAEHRFFKRPYILKVLMDELSSEEGFLGRFEKEISHLAMLEHPNLLKVHQVSLQDGQYFLVTDGIDGMVNLGHYLAQHPGHLPEKQLQSIAEQTAAALDYVYQQGGQPHLGLKLNNVLISQGEEGVHVSLTDFGLTRLMGVGTALNRIYKGLCEAHHLSSQELSSLHTSFLQTYAFLAPEQKIQEDPRALDGKVDVYAFGVLIYYMMTRTYPEGIFPMPSEVAKEYRLNWDRVILSCLQQDPGKRPATLGAVLDQLSEKKKAPATSKVSLKPVLKPQEIARPEYEEDPGAIFQIEAAVGRYQPKQVEIKEVDPLLTEMVIIPEGTYHRGSNHGARDEMPRHAIHLDSFALDVHPVTNEQFVRFLEAMGGEKDVNNNDIIRLRDSRIKRSAGKLNIESGYARHPVVGVTWYGAVAYAKWVGKRLPTEAEWEAAAPGGLEECIYPTGADIERTQANFFSSDTTAVMSYPANAYGLYDMAGNVYEWCQDWYDYQYYNMSIQEPNNPKGPLQGVYRILRGGCWKSLKEDLRCAHRHRNNPGMMNGTSGFRCAADVS
jgi:formylglycine-generating enzyme required for sulfatase activity